MKFKVKHLNLYIMILFGLIAVALFISSIMPTLNTDEPFTISLIKHSYFNVCKIDFYDVHPPLYYLTLKAFLDITTFWTKSVLAKIIFSRLFSLLSFIISFYYLMKIINILRIKVNPIVQLIFFFIFPSIENYSLFIRMYQFSAMLLVLELYGLLLFEYNRHRGIILSIISVSLVSYTNYFAAIFAGSLLIVYLIKYLFKKKYHKSLLVMLAGICDIILFIPCSYFLIHQIGYVSSNHYSNFIGIPSIGRNIWSQLLGAFTGRMISNKLSVLICILLLLIEMCCLVISLKKTYEFGMTLLTIYSAFILGFIPSIVLSIVKHPMIIARYGFPMEFIIIFLTIAFILNQLSHVNKFSFITIILLLLIMLLSVRNLKHNIDNDKNDISTIHSEKIINNSSNKYIYANNMHAIQYSTYLSPNSHKVIIARHLPVKHVLASNNTKLLLKVFNNIKYKE